jgi:hypothetical protein
MTDLATLQQRLDRLKAARSSGVLRLRDGESDVWYRSDAEIAREIAALEDEIAGNSTPRTIVMRSNKGWLK